MLTNLIENRGKEFSNLIKLGDYLARTLRENVELFNVEDGVATYLTESGSVISGKYAFTPTLNLSKIIVEDASVLEDVKSFESATDKKVMKLLSNLLEDDYQSADNSFDKILSMFETKMSYDRIKTRLQEKVERFGEQTKIISSPEFQRVNEIKDKIVEFLKENKNVIQSSGIKNGMKLAALVSTSFDLPRMTVNQIQESKKFEVKTIGKTSIYEHLCRKELIQKELLEAKEGFENIWVTNDSVQELASMIFESDEGTVRHQVAQVVSEAPYLALSTKKQISNLIRNSLSVNEIKAKDREINSFASKIFEMKGPVKKHVINILNEKYGIDVRKLSEVPTFKTLVMTEAEILTHIAGFAPSKSIVKKSLLELARSLKLKNGSEAIDLSDFLNEIFAEAEYAGVLNETSLMDYMDFSRVADDLGKIGQVLKMLGPAVDKVADQVEDHGEDMADDKPMEMGQEKPEDPLGSPDPMDSESETPMDMKPEGPDADEVADEVKGEVEDEEAAAFPEEEMPEEDGEEEMPEEDGEEEMPELDGEEEMEDGEEEMEGEDEGEDVKEMPEDDLTGILSKLEDLLGDLKGDDEGEEEFEDDEEEEEFEDEEEEEEDDDEDDELDPEQYKS
jgi:hypothetical protein